MTGSSTQFQIAPTSTWNTFHVSTPEVDELIDTMQTGSVDESAAAAAGAQPVRRRERVVRAHLPPDVGRGGRCRHDDPDAAGEPVPLPLEHPAEVTAAGGGGTPRRPLLPAAAPCCPLPRSDDSTDEPTRSQTEDELRSMTTCLACDFGGSAVKYALVDDEANLSHSGKARRPPRLDRAVRGHRGRSARALPRGGRDRDQHPRHDRPRDGAPLRVGAYTALYGVDIAGIVRDRCGVEVTVENDGKCAALSEAWVGGLVDDPDGAVIILGSVWPEASSKTGACTTVPTSRRARSRSS